MKKLERKEDAGQEGKKKGPKRLGRVSERDMTKRHRGSGGSGWLRKVRKKEERLRFFRHLFPKPGCLNLRMPFKIPGLPRRVVFDASPPVFTFQTTSLLFLSDPASVFFFGSLYLLHTLRSEFHIGVQSYISSTVYASGYSTNGELQDNGGVFTLVSLRMKFMQRFVSIRGSKHRGSRHPSGRGARARVVDETGPNVN